MVLTERYLEHRVHPPRRMDSNILFFKKKPERKQKNNKTKIFQRFKMANMIRYDHQMMRHHRLRLCSKKENEEPFKFGNWPTF